MPPESNSLDLLATLRALLPFLIPLVIAGVKLLIPRIPKWLLPILAPVLGALTEITAHFAGVTGTDVVLGMVLGGAGVAVREITDQLRKHQAGGLALALLYVGLLIGASSVIGCTQRQLDAAGIYGSGTAAVGLTPAASEAAKQAAGRVLFEADSVITRADTLFNEFIAWEQAHRAGLALWPAIRIAAEDIARQKDNWLREAIRHRDEFARRPITERATALENSLSLIRHALATALGHMAERAHPQPITL